MHSHIASRNLHIADEENVAQPGGISLCIPRFTKEQFKSLIPVCVDLPFHRSSNESAVVDSDSFLELHTRPDELDAAPTAHTLQGIRGPFPLDSSDRSLYRSPSRNRSILVNYR